MSRRLYILLTLTLLVGAFLRLWQLSAVPPGLHYDLAATALLGNEVAFHGYRPIFITAFTGHEALFYYWLALWFRLIGSSIFALRLAAATLGILTLAASFFALRHVLRAVLEEQAAQVAALATICLAFAFFHVTFSRFGFRVISEPLIQSLALGFLFRGLQRTKHKAQGSGRLFEFWILRFGIWDLILAGAFTGLAAYTYLAARLFPIPLAVFWLALLGLAFRARPVGNWVLGFGIFSFSALAAFAPLGLYFWQHPEDFLNRAGQLTPRPGEAQLLLTGVRRALEMLFINGEPYDRFNLPGLPLLYPVLGVFFVIGFLISLRNFVRPPGALTSAPLSRATELLLLVWVPALLIPTAVSVHDIFPSNVRAFGEIPLLFIFPARGLAASARWLQKRWPALTLPRLAYATLLIGALVTAHNYFTVWAALPNQRLNNDADLTAMADYLNAQDLTDTSIFMSAIHYRHPTLAYLARDFSSIRWFTGGTSLAVPAAGASLYLFARSAPLPEDWLTAWAPYLVAAPSNQDFRAYRFESEVTPPLPPFESATANFSNLATLTGYHFIPQEKQLLVDVRWRVENVPEGGDFLPYARLSDEQTAWAQSGGFSYPSEQWVVGDTVLARLSIPLPAGLPPGAYRVTVGFYSATANTNLARLDAAGEYAGQTVSLPPVELAGRLVAPLEELATAQAMEMPQSNNFTTGLQLLGYTANTLSPRQGERVWLTLFWRASETMALPAQSFTLGAYASTASFPVSQLDAGQVLIQHLILHLPPEQAPGVTPLRVEVPGFGSATLTDLDVQSVVRSFVAPPGLTETHYRLGEAFELYGYKLEAGPLTRLTLVWRSLAVSAEDYTVFVHLLGPDILADQRDAQPQAGAYPTSLWTPGEFIVDEYEFGLGRGAWRFEAGLYLPESGARLPVRDAAGNETGNAITLPVFSLP